jgi:hypothetical protein
MSLRTISVGTVRYIKCIVDPPTFSNSCSAIFSYYFTRILNNNMHTYYTVSAAIRPKICIGTNPLQSRVLPKIFSLTSRNPTPSIWSTLRTIRCSSERSACLTGTCSIRNTNRQDYMPRHDPSEDAPSTSPTSQVTTIRTFSASWFCRTVVS